MTDDPDRDLVKLSDLSPEGIREILQRSIQMRTSKPAITTTSDHVGLLFSEPSTRTSLSFLAASQRLGVHPLELRAEASSLSKGESLLDTAITLEALGANAIVVRDGDEQTAATLARHCRAGVINAGGGTRAHPSQGLLDALTLLDEFGDLQGKTIGIVGDILHSRVARSDIVAFRALGARVILVAPGELHDQELEGDGVELSDDLDSTLPQLDAIQMLRIQHERIESGLRMDRELYVERYRLDEARLDTAKETLIVMHPGPINREVEITSVVADGQRSRIRQQVSNGVPVRMALLERALRRSGG